VIEVVAVPPPAATAPATAPANAPATAPAAATPAPALPAAIHPPV
jgi:hypothetical protein